MTTFLNNTKTNSEFHVEVYISCHAKISSQLNYTHLFIVTDCIVVDGKYIDCNVSPTLSAFNPQIVAPDGKTYHIVTSL